MKNRPIGRSGKKEKLLQYGSHLVYAEGTKTEPLYIENIKRILNEKLEYRNSNMKIKIVDESGGRGTLNLLKYVEKDINNRLKKFEKIDYVWIFYDYDSFPKDRFDNTYVSIVSKNKNKYRDKHTDNLDCDNHGICWKACWSNESFELWAVLHFQYLQTAMNRNEYIDIINKNISDKKDKYEKNKKNIYDILSKYGSIKNAIRDAKRLNDNLTNKNIKANPSTGVYQFLEHFERYLDIK